MRFYTNVAQHKSDLLVREIVDGVPELRKVRYEPYLFIPTKERTIYKTVTGQPVKRVDFPSIYDAREFIGRYEDVEGFPVYGMTNWQYPYINDEYGDEVAYDVSQISIVFLDIETEADKGFPKIQEANCALTAITIRRDDRIEVFGCRDFNPPEGVIYHHCVNEIDMIYKFLNRWNDPDFFPDIVSGWNVEQFDIPYLVNRITRMIGDEAARRLSPWKILQEREVFIQGRPVQIYTPVGLSIIDYLPLYQKFKMQKQESYKLDHIGFVEGVGRKLDYSEFSSLHDLYLYDFQKYVEYNIQDVQVVAALERKLKFIEQLLALAYDVKINYNDAFTTVRPWDVMIHNYLMARNIVVPPMKVQQSTTQIPGGHVKDPDVGTYHWVISFDVTSLYPHLIMGYNISPETYRGQVDFGTSVDTILDGIYNTDTAMAIKAKNLALTGHGSMFTREFQGFLPALMQRLFNDRVGYKKEMLRIKQELQREDLTPDERKKLEAAFAQADSRQNAKKIQLNSGYGALANQYFRWYQLALGASVTMSGQLTIRWAERAINGYLNKVLKTEGTDYVIAIDTDSCYITLDSLVKKMYGDEPDPQKVVDFLDKVCEEKLAPVLKGAFDDLAQYMNAYEQKISMKREAIASKGIWTAKKRYALNVYNLEGVKFAKPTLKVQGFESVRSSTPQIARDGIKKAIDIIMNGTYDEFQAFIKEFKADYFKQPFDKIATPKGCNGILKYADPITCWGKKTPPHVRGALVFNREIEKRGLENKFRPVYEGDKVKYGMLREPNPFMADVIACPDMMPQEFEVEKYLNYNAQYERDFEEPIGRIAGAHKWAIVPTITLDDLFG